MRGKLNIAHCPTRPRLSTSTPVGSAACIGQLEQGLQRVTGLLREHGKGNPSSSTVLDEFSICSAQFGICGVRTES